MDSNIQWTTQSPSIHSSDPSLTDGYKIVFNHEVPFEVRSQNEDSDGPNQGVLEMIKVKILVRDSGNEIEGVRVELSSEVRINVNVNCKLY